MIRQPECARLIARWRSLPWVAQGDFLGVIGVRELSEQGPELFEGSGRGRAGGESAVDGLVEAFHLALCGGGAASCFRTMCRSARSCSNPLGWAREPSWLRTKRVVQTRPLSV